MTRRLPKRLHRDTGGAAAVEFAMTALGLLTLLIGAIELGVLAWQWQVLQSAAQDAARCAGIESTTCGNVTTSTTATINYAVTSAQSRGLTSFTSSGAAVNTGSTAQTACGATNMVEVVLTYSYGAMFLAALPTSLSAMACYPLP